MAVIDGKWLSKEGLTYFWSKIKAIFTNQQLEINYSINTGSKNKLIITNQNNTLTVNGITFTKNDDQTITATGTATANADYPLNSALTLIIGQQYILSGCPSGGGADNFFLRQLSGAVDYGNGVTFVAESSSANFFIRIRNGYSIQGSLTFKPMLRPAEITDDTFALYAPSNRELYELCETKASLNDIYGKKNQLPNGTDLNNLTAGCMTCSGATVAASLLNCPTTTDAFIIYTDYLAATSRVIQRIYSFNTNTGLPAQYMRVRWSQGWTPWYQVMMQSVASAQSAASLMQDGRLDAELTDAQEVTDDA